LTPSAPEVLAAVDLLAIVSEKAAKRDGCGSTAEKVAACYRSAARALREAEEIQRAALPPKTSGAPT
jgi:hypothetical protein